MGPSHRVLTIDHSFGQEANHGREKLPTSNKAVKTDGSLTDTCIYSYSAASCRRHSNSFIFIWGTLAFGSFGIDIYLTSIRRWPCLAPADCSPMHSLPSDLVGGFLAYFSPFFRSEHHSAEGRVYVSLFFFCEKCCDNWPYSYRWRTCAYHTDCRKPYATQAQWTRWCYLLSTTLESVLADRVRRRCGWCCFV